MSEKRFFKAYFTKQIIDKVTDKCYPIRDGESIDELVDLLNELSTENQQLKEEAKLVNAFLVEKGLEVDYRRWHLNVKRELKESDDE